MLGLCMSLFDLCLAKIAPQWLEGLPAAVSSILSMHMSARRALPIPQSRLRIAELQICYHGYGRGGISNEQQILQDWHTYTGTPE